MRKIYFISFLLLSVLAIQGQQLGRSYVGYSQEGNKLMVKMTDGTYVIEPYNNKVVHTTYLPKEGASKSFSYASNQKPEQVAMTISDGKTTLDIKAGDIHIILTKSTANISYFYKGKPLVSDVKGCTITPSSKAISLTIDSTETLYGGGARALGMNRRGNKLTLYNRAHYGYGERSELMNYTLPLVMSSKQYAILFDNASTGSLDLDSKKTNEITYETVGGTLNYYVIAGADWYDLVSQYTALTGRQPLLPRWALGNFSSRFGYHSQEEVLSTIQKFEKDKIPVDAIIIDIYWFGKGIFNDMGTLDWYKDSFPNPTQMMTDLTKKGVKTILVTEPFILSTSKRWQEAVDNKVLCTDSLGKPFTYNFYFGNTGLIDMFDPKATSWFWNIYKGLNQQGVGGWWGDLGEPEVHPSPLQHINGSADDVHNAYGHQWAKLLYEGYKTDFPTIRPFILMRAGYAGSQRYGMIPWTGDVNRSWGGLSSQPEIALQMGMQGLAFTHSDLGGFAMGDSIDNELYIRWLQYGVFQPIYRPHAQENIPAEPVFHNKHTKAIVKESILLRYQLKPYNYTLAFDNNQTGKPLMRPLLFDEPTNTILLNYDKAYMWGDAFLVSPIKEKGIKQQTLYLPKGATWFDFYTGTPYNGGQEITADLSIDHIPVYVKGGSFIPMAKVSNEDNYSLDTLDIHYYADNQVQKSSYRLYHDDGKTPNAFEKGQYEWLSLAATNQGKQIEVIFTPSYGANQPKKNRQVLLSMHHMSTCPKSISINGKKIAKKAITYNAQTKVLQFNVAVMDVAQKVVVGL